MKVGLIQLNAGENKKRNIERACSLVETASSSGAKFVLLPEVFNYRGPLSGKKLYNEIAEDLPGFSINPLLEISRRRKIYILAGSIYEKSKEKNKVYNTSVVIDNFGKIIAKYRKINLFKATIDGSIIDEIQLDHDDPYPHGMSIKGNKMWISDANFGGKMHSDTLMGKPSFNTINL